MNPPQRTHAQRSHPQRPLRLLVTLTLTSWASWGLWSLTTQPPQRGEGSAQQEDEAQEPPPLSLSDVETSWWLEGAPSEVLLWVNGEPLQRAHLIAHQETRRKEHSGALLAYELITLTLIKQHERQHKLSPSPSPEPPQSTKGLSTQGLSTQGRAPLKGEAQGELTEGVVFVISLPYEQGGSPGERLHLQDKLTALSDALRNKTLTLESASSQHSPRAHLPRGLVPFKSLQEPPSPFSSQLLNAISSLTLGEVSSPLFDERGAYLIKLMSVTRTSSSEERARFELERQRAERSRVKRHEARIKLTQELLSAATLTLSAHAPLKRPSKRLEPSPEIPRLTLTLSAHPHRSPQ